MLIFVLTCCVLYAILVRRINENTDKREVFIMSDEFMTAKELAKKVNVHPLTITRWVKSGQLKPHHISPGGRKYYSEEQVKIILGKETSCGSKK